MTVSVVCTDAALEALVGEWRELFQRCPDAMPFQSPDWLFPCWQVFGTGRPVVATLRQNARLVGVLPLYILEDKLLPIGAGITDYQDMLLEPSQPAEAAATLLDAGLKAAGVFRCDLIDLPPDAVLKTVSLPVGWNVCAQTTDPCPVLTLGDGVEQLPAGKRRDLRQFRHRADRTGGLTVETATPDTSETMLSALYALHERRLPGLDPRLWRFHKQAAPLLHRAGLLRMYVLKLRGQCAAGYYTLLARNRILFYFSGFEPHFAHESPSTILMGEIITRAIAENRRELHFLRGDEAYKYSWGANDRFNTTLSLRATQG